MPKQSTVYTQDFDNILKELVAKYGDTKWADITRMLKTIYGFNIPQKAMVQARWKALNPKICRDQLNDEDMVEHWKICVHYRCHWDSVKHEYLNKKKQQRDKSYLSQKFYSHFSLKLSELNKIYLNRNPLTQQKIDAMRDTTKRRILIIAARDLATVKEDDSKEIIVSSRLLVNLLTFLVENYKMEKKEMQRKLLQKNTPAQFQKMLLNAFTVDTILLISLNDFRAIDDTSDLFDLKEKEQALFRKPISIKKWEDALELPSSPDQSEPEEALKTAQKLTRSGISNYFTKADTRYVILI